MKKTAGIGLWILTLSLVSGMSRARGDANPGFDKLRMLVGEWEGKDAQEKPVRVSYKMVSAGTALLETLSPGGESEMVTIYTMDGDAVALTHYCSANNQPRMRTVPNAGDPNELDFTFVGATNLADPGVGHMHRLAITIQDGDHFTQEWTWRERGKADTIEIFRFTRKK
ncbi:MAG: hypothetical protein LAP85_12300 [Acidobacteriia bacterium]|nr:hypothetical protein [Terriglobia bacterium]